MNAHDPKDWLHSWLEQLLLRRQPQDDAVSYAALLAALSAYVLMGVLLALGDWPLIEAIALSMLDVLVMVAFTGTLLAMAQKYQRLVQTLTALAGTGALLGVIGLPLFLLRATQAQESEPPVAFAFGWLLLLGWNIAVQAHIFRHALSARYGLGFLVAILHTMVMITLLETLFPDVLETGGMQE